MCLEKKGNSRPITTETQDTKQIATNKVPFFFNNKNADQLILSCNTPPTTLLPP